jgi:cytochrome c556
MKKLPLMIGLIVAAAALHAADATKRDIDTVMKEAMKGETSLHKKVATGKGSKEDAVKLLDYFKSLPAETPPEGSAESWKEKTGKLIEAAQAVVDGKPGATNGLQTAGNCKACHSEHKGK